MKKEVFISYKIEDFKEADWVRSVLEQNGISCWMAPMSIPGGSSYAVEIPNAIARCDYFVLILSKKAQLSKWISREVDRAINEDKVLLPYVIENCELSPEYKFYLTNVQYYYAYLDRTAAINKLIRDIQNKPQLSSVTLAQEKDESYDVFITCKLTDEDGNRTMDSLIARQLYDRLTENGLKVYYSAISLADKIGQDYEKINTQAVNSAKVMVVVGTTRQRMCAPVVKNDWSRFLKLKESDPSKFLIPCYQYMEVFDLPQEFLRLQAVDFGELGALADLCRNIKKIVGKYR